VSKPAILCVDDERIILTSLKAQLQNSLDNKFQIELAESAEEALEIIEEFIESQTELPLVIADQIMGGMHGDEFLAQVKQRLPATHSIMLTGQASAESVGQAVNKAGLFRFIPKPWQEEDLLLTVQTALKSYNHQKSLVRQNSYQDVLNKILKLALKPLPLEEQLSEALTTILSTPCFNELNKGSIYIDQPVSGQTELVMISHINQGDPITMPPSMSDKRPQEILLLHESSYYQAPILINEKVVGFLFIHVPDTHQKSLQTETFLSAFCHTLAGMIKVSEYNLALKQNSIELGKLVEMRTQDLNQALKKLAEHNALLSKTNKELEYFATTDELTGLINRRCFFDRANAEAKRSHRYKTHTVFAMLDLDFFKVINDDFGHQVGDTVLSEVAKVLADSIREQDIIGRVGGEEFAIIMPETELSASNATCERIQQNVSAMQINIQEKVISVSVSIGITALKLDETTIDGAMSRADQALYDSKDKGRNLISLIL